MYYVIVIHETTTKVAVAMVIKQPFNDPAATQACTHAQLLLAGETKLALAVRVVYPPVQLWKWKWRKWLGPVDPELLLDALLTTSGTSSTHLAHSANIDRFTIDCNVTAFIKQQ